MSLLEAGERVDRFVIDGSLHAGGMAQIYRVHAADPAAQPDFPLVMKVPRMTAGDGAETLVGFEVEKRILALLHGPHVPRFVAAGDVTALPYLVIEYVAGRTLQDWLDSGSARDPAEIAHIGAAIARAVQSIHRQQVCHEDLKPANVLLRDGGGVVLLDFGLSWHAQSPDLLAEAQRATAGSAIWMAPEQVAGVRGDPRSDIFAIGVMLYEMCTGELPFGNPQTRGGLRQRQWIQPVPPRRLNPGVPEWLQEIILRCLEPLGADRHPSAALLAFDLAHPEQVRITERGARLQGQGFWASLRQWLARDRYQPSALPSGRLAQSTIVMAAVPHRDASAAALDALARAAHRVLGNRPGARLACVTVVAAAGVADAARSEVALHQQMLACLRDFAQRVEPGNHPVSYHVLEGDVAEAILAYAQNNHVDVIIMGAATHGLQLQRFVATVPIKVAMRAPCTVMLVKPTQ